MTLEDFWNAAKRRAAKKAPGAPPNQAAPSIPEPAPSAPAPTPPPDAPEPPTAPPPSLNEPQTPVIPPGSMSGLIGQVNDKIHQADRALAIGTKEATDAASAINALELKMDELTNRGGDKDEWSTVVEGLKQEKKTAERLMKNLTSAGAGLPQLNQPENTPEVDKKINEMGNSIGSLNKEVHELQDRITILLEKAGEARRMPVDKSIAKGLATPTATPTTSLAQSVTARPKGSAHLPLETALHHGMRRVAETVSPELEQELNVARPEINRHMLEILDLLKKGSRCLIDKHAYDFDSETRQVHALADSDLEKQLDLTTTAMERFEDTVRSLPQMVEDIKAELDYREEVYRTIAQRQERPERPTPKLIDPWDPALAPKLAPPAAIERPADVHMPDEADLIHGAGESKAATALLADTVRAIKETKGRTDKQVFTVLNTINEILSQGLGISDGSASAYEYDVDGFMKVKVDTWVATRDTARTLVPITERLVKEIDDLITESRAGKEAVAHQAAQAQNINTP